MPDPALHEKFTTEWQHFRIPPICPLTHTSDEQLRKDNERCYVSNGAITGHSSCIRDMIIAARTGDCQGQKALEELDKRSTAALLQEPFWVVTSSGVGAPTLSTFCANCSDFVTPETFSEMRRKGFEFLARERFDRIRYCHTSSEDCESAGPVLTHDQLKKLSDAKPIELPFQLASGSEGKTFDPRSKLSTVPTESLRNRFNTFAGLPYDPQHGDPARAPDFKDPAREEAHHDEDIYEILSLPKEGLSPPVGTAKS